MTDKPVRFWLGCCLFVNNMWTACDLVSPLRLRSTVGQQGHNAWWNECLVYKTGLKGHLEVVGNQLSFYHGITTSIARFVAEKVLQASNSFH
jgi:hypothetical protein